MIINGARLVGLVDPGARDLVQMHLHPISVQLAAIEHAISHGDRLEAAAHVRAGQFEEDGMSRGARYHVAGQGLDLGLRAKCLRSSAISIQARQLVGAHAIAGDGGTADQPEKNERPAPWLHRHPTSVSFTSEQASCRGRGARVAARMRATARPRSDIDVAPASYPTPAARASASSAAENIGPATISASSPAPSSTK